VDLSAVGRTTLSFWSAMLKRADADLSSSSSSPNVAAKNSNTEGHVKYENLIKDPVGTIRELYRSFGWDFSKVLGCVRAASEVVRITERKRKKFVDGDEYCHQPPFYLEL